MAIIRESKNISNPEKWGLPKEAIESLAQRLRDIWIRFRKLFKTTTRDTSEHAHTYVRGLLTMDTKRNYANIACRVLDPREDGQNIQQFISDSPWEAIALRLNLKITL